MANKVIHKRSIQKGLLPSGTTLDYGEIAVNYNSGEPFLSIRTTESGKTDTKYAKFIDEATIDAKIKNVENQNAFSKVAVSGKSTIEADSATDTLTFAAGSNISITTDASNDKITIAATGLSASGHNHDDRYYTESEITALLNKKSDTGHTHSQYSETGHTHDGVYKPVQAIVSDPTASTATTTTFIDTISQNENGVITATKKTVKLANALTFGSKTFDGSSAQTITAADLGLGAALKYCGITTTALTDGATTNPIKINNANHTATAGCVVFYGDKEFVFNGTNWELLGAEATYKVVQTAVSDPTASGNSTTFISTISQDKNGVIAATKKTVPIAKFDTLGLVKPSKSYTGAATLTTAAASTTTAPTINAITTTAGKYYAVEVDKNGVPFVNVPWSDTNTDTHYTTHMYLGNSTATADATTDVTNPYIRLFDNTTAREDIQVVGQNNLTVKGKNGVITIDGTHNHDGTYLKSYTETYQGTLTGITVTGASGLTGSGTISKTTGKTGGTITLGHATKSVSITTPTGTTKLSHEGTFVIPTIGYDSYGHVSGITNTTYKLPSDNNTWRPVYNGVDSTSTESGATANAVKTAYDLANSKWTYNADTIKGVKVNNAAAADKVSSAITLTYGSTTGKTGSITYSGNSKPTVYIPTSTSHITNDSGYITSAHTHTASAITGGTNGYFLTADSNGKGTWTSLPTASPSVKGGVKVGKFLRMSGDTTLYVQTGITSSTVAVGNHTHSTYATKDEIAAINQTIEEHELVTAEALVNLNDRVTNIVNTDSTSEKAYLTGLAESGEGEIVMNNDVYMAGGNIYVQDGKIVATQEYLDENLETLAAAAVDLNNRLNNGAPVKVEKSENVRAELGGFVVRNWNNEVPEIHTSHYVSSGVYMEQNSVYTVNGFYQTSDERKKNFENEIEVDFNKLKEIPKSYFTWKDDEKQVRNIGTSAQKLAEIYPELVSYNETDDEYSVSYAELSIVALKAVDKLYEENQMLREELAMIKKHLGL